MMRLIVAAFAVALLAGCGQPEATATAPVNVSKLCKVLDTAEKCASDARCIWAEAGKDTGDKPHCKDK